MATLRPMMMPWLGSDECKQRLQAARLTAEKAAGLAEAVSRFWAAEQPDYLAHCSCLAPLQAGSHVRRCRESRSYTCAAVQLNNFLLPASPSPEAQQHAACSTAGFSSGLRSDRTRLLAAVQRSRLLPASSSLGVQQHVACSTAGSSTGLRSSHTRLRPAVQPSQVLPRLKGCQDTNSTTRHCPV